MYTHGPDFLVQFEEQANAAAVAAAAAARAAARAQVVLVLVILVFRDSSRGIFINGPLMP